MINPADSQYQSLTFLQADPKEQANFDLWGALYMAEAFYRLCKVPRRDHAKNQDRSWREVQADIDLALSMLNGIEPSLVQEMEDIGSKLLLMAHLQGLYDTGRV